MTTDWSTISAAWATAVGTIGASVVALLIARRGWKLEAEDRSDRSAAQARLITFSSSKAGAPLTADIVNHSLLPILRLAVVEAYRMKGNERERVKVIPVGADDDGGWSVLLPEQTVNVRFEAFSGSQHLSPGNYFELIFEFIDQAGLRWRRRSNEQPERVIPPSAQAARGRTWLKLASFLRRSSEHHSRGRHTGIGE